MTLAQNKVDMRSQIENLNGYPESVRKFRAQTGAEYYLVNSLG